MKNMRSFTITFVPWSETKPSRVRIFDNRYKKRYFASFTDSPSDRSEEVAQAWLLKRGITCSILTEGKKGFILLTDNFNEIER